MRLINADALEYRRRYRIGKPVEYLDKSDIDLAPTIDPESFRLKGKWKIEMDDMGWLRHTCPICGYIKRTDISVSLGWNYCPKCGTKME